MRCVSHGGSTPDISKIIDVQTMCTCLWQAGEALYAAQLV